MTFLINPHIYTAAGGGSGITGYDTPQMFRSTVNASSYSAIGTVLGVAVGDLVYVHLHGMGNGTSLLPGNFTATLGGVSMGTPNQWGSSGNTQPGSAGFLHIATAAGNLSLDVGFGAGSRGVVVIVWVLKGFNTGTPIGAKGSPGVTSSDVTTHALPSGGFTTGANNNVGLFSSCIKGGDITAMSMTNVDGYSSTTSGGTSTADDISVVWGWVKKPTAGLLSVSSNWTGADRVASLYTEVNV